MIPKYDLQSRKLSILIRFVFLKTHCFLASLKLYYENNFMLPNIKFNNQYLTTLFHKRRLKLLKKGEVLLISIMLVLVTLSTWIELEMTLGLKSKRQKLNCQSVLASRFYSLSLCLCVYACAHHFSLWMLKG